MDIEQAQFRIEQLESLSSQLEFNLQKANKEIEELSERVKDLNEQLNISELAKKEQDIHSGFRISLIIITNDAKQQKGITDEIRYVASAAEAQK